MSNSTNPGNFKPGNKFWENRTRHGREKIFALPEMLWEESCKYFTWCIENPLYEAKLVKTDDGHKMEKLPKVRAFTKTGLCLYLGVSKSYLRNFKAAILAKDQKKRKPIDADFLTVIEQIDEVIYEQKFVNAAAGFLQHNIIARDLGLIDKQAS